MTTHKTHNYFSGDIFEDVEKFVRHSRKDIKAMCPEFDTFVVRGMSGAVAGGILARALKKNLYVIRKDNDSSHQGSNPFGAMGDRWLFLDDFASSGATFWATYDRVAEMMMSRGTWDYSGGYGPSRVIPAHRFIPTPPPTFVGAYMYSRRLGYDVNAFDDYLRSMWGSTGRSLR